jgi:uncharacterized protein YbbK (DUF523 family)
MEKILISACLLGDIVRYDGCQKKMNHVPAQRWVQRWEDQGRLVWFCPEVAGGLKTPRPPGEIVNGDGQDVLEHRAWVRTSTGEDVTPQFIRGAAMALDLIKTHAIKMAILKAKSPSCGSDLIYDGTFENRLTEGVGVTTALLRRNGIFVFSEYEIETVKSLIYLGL